MAEDLVDGARDLAALDMGGADIVGGGDERAAPVRVTLASHGYGLAVRGAF